MPELARVDMLRILFCFLVRFTFQLDLFRCEGKPKARKSKRGFKKGKFSGVVGGRLRYLFITPTKILFR